jgi:hypothetical protein
MLFASSYRAVASELSNDTNVTHLSQQYHDSLVSIDLARTVSPTCNGCCAFSVKSPADATDLHKLLET